jgi:glycosyltransferase involved in cell wall biosynthesis
MPQSNSKSATRQRGSHRGQLAQFERTAVVPDSVHAIVVPTSRPASSLRAVVELAKRLDCALLVLSSKQSKVEDVARVASGAKVFVVDVDELGGVLPSFGTDAELVGTRFHRDTDLSFKRNLGLLFALLAGWQRIVFLDDDIVVPEPEDLRRAAGLLHRYPAVGLGLAGFPDNSVVCHANRAVGRFQETFIGGGAMAVDVGRMNSFFPNIYNEDWFFLLGGRKTGKFGVVGRADQSEYDPYRSVERALSEEFGDCLAEGLYALLDAGHFSRSAMKEYWSEFLVARRALINDIVGSVHAMPGSAELRTCMTDALNAALERCTMIEPEFCVNYLNAWHDDRRAWSEFVLRACRSHRINVGESGPDAAMRTIRLPADRFDQDEADLHRAGPHINPPGPTPDLPESPVLVAEAAVEPDNSDVGLLHRERDSAMAPAS